MKISIVNAMLATLFLSSCSFISFDQSKEHNKPHIVKEWRTGRHHARKNTGPVFQELVGHSFSGYYESCRKIRLSFTSHCDVVADLWSTEWVGRGSWKVKGHYSFHDPVIIIEWENEYEYNGSMKMDYLVFDKESCEMIIYAPKEVYYLNYPIMAEQVPFHAYEDSLDLSVVPYEMIAKDSIINDYFSHRDYLRFINGYEITYDEILSNIMQKSNLSKTERWPSISQNNVKYEDDSLLIYFKDITVLQPKGEREARIRDYSVRPLAAFDKRIPAKK